MCKASYVITAYCGIQYPVGFWSLLINSLMPYMQLKLTSLLIFFGYIYEEMSMFSSPSQFSHEPEKASPSHLSHYAANTAVSLHLLLSG